MIILRDFRESDRQALRHLYRDTQIATFHWLPASSFTLGDFDASIRGEEVFVAELQGQIAGFASVWVPDRFIHSLFVDPAWQGRGVGKALLQRCVDRLGVPVTLKCQQRNLRAIAFYQSQGWTIVEGAEDGLRGAYFLLRSATANDVPSKFNGDCLI